LKCWFCNEDLVLGAPWREGAIGTLVAQAECHNSSCKAVFKVEMTCRSVGQHEDSRVVTEAIQRLQQIEQIEQGG